MTKRGRTWLKWIALAALPVLLVAVLLLSARDRLQGPREAVTSRGGERDATLSTEAVVATEPGAPAIAAGRPMEVRQVDAQQAKEYEAEVPKSIVELQPLRRTASIRIASQAGRKGTAVLIDLNPAVGAWYLLNVSWQDGSGDRSYHLENPKPGTRRLILDEKYSSGLTMVEANQRYVCDLWGAATPNTLDKAQASGLAAAPLCEGRIYLRNPVTGHRTALEAAAEFFREHVWGGEQIVDLGHYLLGDRYAETAKIETQAGAEAGANPANGPLPALIDAQYSDRRLTSGNLGIVLQTPQASGMAPGAWYAAAGNPGVYVSILQPNLIDPRILQSYKTTVNPLDHVEQSTLCYLIAFDLGRFELGYALGTSHPLVGWSNRALSQVRDAKLPGPDGIGNIRPLVSTGLIMPEYAPRTVSTFTGGFKRTHGAFKYGEFALKNHGSHYGFIENGVVFSKLQPGLATILVLNDGSLEMRTWTEQDRRLFLGNDAGGDQAVPSGTKSVSGSGERGPASALLARIRHARQNGVPIVEFDEASQTTVPGKLVNRWGPGNWSGSENMELRTLRSGAALAQNRGKRFLIYAVFSDATPSAMARVFQAYQCRYAMLLDMNALEHTYLALYRRSGSQIFVDHLLKGMAQLDKSVSGQLVPRFLGYADNRDFFYVMRRPAVGKETALKEASP